MAKKDWKKVGDDEWHKNRKSLAIKEELKSSINKNDYSVVLNTFDGMHKVLKKDLTHPKAMRYIKNYMRKH